jgi:hypothetical protein
MTWIVQGDERRELIRRYIFLQMKQVYKHVFDYVEDQTSVDDVCLANLLEWLPNEIEAGFLEEPEDKSDKEEMVRIYEVLMQNTEVDDPCH